MQGNCRDGRQAPKVRGQRRAAHPAQGGAAASFRRSQRKLNAIYFSFQREGNIMYEDKTLVCKECGKEFVFTAGEQEFYAERGFQNEPQRCKACATPARTPPAAPVSTSPPCAPPAAARPACPSSRSLTVPYTAASASPRCGRSRDKRISVFVSCGGGAHLGAAPSFCAPDGAIPSPPSELQVSMLFRDFLLKKYRKLSIIPLLNFRIRMGGTSDDRN